MMRVFSWGVSSRADGDEEVAVGVAVMFSRAKLDALGGFATASSALDGASDGALGSLVGGSFSGLRAWPLRRIGLRRMMV